MMQPPLAVTMGDPAGVGSELAAQAWLRRERDDLPVFFAVADPVFLERRIVEAGLAAPIKVIVGPADAHAAFGAALPVLPLDRSVASGLAGVPSVADAGAVVEAIERAVALVIGGDAAAVVTAPVHKETLYRAGFAFPGHTEFLGDLARRRGLAACPVMMLACPELRVVPATVHIPLAAVPAHLTTDLIVETGRIVAGDLKARFGLTAPRLAVAGLNPHAGEGGQIGTEDRDIIVPAIDRLVKSGIHASGPFAADTLFHRQARASYDAVIAMYHDQALIPIKTIAFDSAVNVTLGLPFVRTSPDHGTALTLAGSGRADPSSLIAAIAMAGTMAARQPAGVA